MVAQVRFLCSIYYVNSKISVSGAPVCIYYFSWRNRFSKREIDDDSVDKTFGVRCLAGSLVKTLLSQEIFVTRVVDLKLNSKCGRMHRKKRLCLQGDSSNAFPVKGFVQYKLILT